MKKIIKKKKQKSNKQKVEGEVKGLKRNVKYIKSWAKQKQIRKWRRKKKRV